MDSVTGPSILDRVLFTVWFITVGTVLYATARMMVTWTYRWLVRHD